MWQAACQPPVGMSFGVARGPFRRIADGCRSAHSIRTVSAGWAVSVAAAVAKKRDRPGRRRRRRLSGRPPRGYLVVWKCSQPSTQDVAKQRGRPDAMTIQGRTSGATARTTRVLGTSETLGTTGSSETNRTGGITVRQQPPERMWLTRSAMVSRSRALWWRIACSRRRLCRRRRASPLCRARTKS